MELRYALKSTFLLAFSARKEALLSDDHFTMDGGLIKAVKKFFTALIF